MLAEGIGEELTRLPAMPKCTVLIAKPPVSVSTKMVYEALDAEEIPKHPDIDGIIKGLEEGDLRQIACSMGNVLEDVTIPMHPVIAQIKQEMLEAGAIGAMMSGSDRRSSACSRTGRRRGPRRKISGKNHWPDRSM